MADAYRDADSGVIDAGLPIIDPHHHLGYQFGGRYLVEEFRDDLASGHNVVATVYVECGSMYRYHGPETLRPVGEAEFVGGMAAMSASFQFGPTRICAGFVGAADLTSGDQLDDVLEALDVASGFRLRGIRGSAVWDGDPAVNTGTRPFARPGMLLDAAFRSGFSRLVERGLVYDAWQYHPQLPDVASLADAFPRSTIVVNHCGGLLGIGPYDRASEFQRWRALVSDVARRPNIMMKLGGLGAKRCGFGFDTRATPTSANELATLWRPYIETCIELFGPARCMFESNFPPDRDAGSYRTLWNAFKLIAASASDAEKIDLFQQSARRVYGIE